MFRFTRCLMVLMVSFDYNQGFVCVLFAPFSTIFPRFHHFVRPKQMNSTVRRERRIDLHANVEDNVADVAIIGTIEQFKTSA